MVGLGVHRKTPLKMPHLIFFLKSSSREKQTVLFESTNEEFSFEWPQHIGFGPQTQKLERT